jgi:hypothetical protein
MSILLHVLCNSNFEDEDVKSNSVKIFSKTMQYKLSFKAVILIILLKRSHSSQYYIKYVS